LANDDRSTNREGTTHRPTAQERGLADAKKAPEKTKAAPAPPAKVDLLDLHHSKEGDELEHDRAFGRLRYPGARQVRIKSWKDLAAKLAANKQIGTLVLMTHGVPGGLQIDKWMGGADAGAFLKKTGAQVDKIMFEGCMIMRSPVEAAELAKGLSARTAIGYTWWHYTGKQVWTLPKKPASNELKSAIAVWATDTAKFLIRTQSGTLNQKSTGEGILKALEASVPKKGKGSGSIRLYLEWFFPTQGSGGRPDPSDRPREDLIKETLDTKSGAEAFAKKDHANLGAVEATVNVAKILP
jgi:hypothetical protein